MLLMWLAGARDDNTKLVLKNYGWEFWAVQELPEGFAQGLSFVSSTLEISQSWVDFCGVCGKAFKEKYTSYSNLEQEITEETSNQHTEKPKKRLGKDVGREGKALEISSIHWKI
jgi:hypothetical protein